MNCHLCGMEIAADQRCFSRNGVPFVHTGCVGDKAQAKNGASAPRIYDDICRGERSRQTKPDLDAYDRR